MASLIFYISIFHEPNQMTTVKAVVGHSVDRTVTASPRPLGNSSPETEPSLSPCGRPKNVHQTLCMAPSQQPGNANGDVTVVNNGSSWNQVGRDRAHSIRNVPLPNNGNNSQARRQHVNGNRSRSRPRSRQIFIGQRPSTGDMTWGGNEFNAHRYIGNVRSDADIEVIKKDIEAKGVAVVSLVQNKTEKPARSISFKLTVKKSDCAKIDDATFWPTNVIVRYWHKPRLPRDRRGNDGEGTREVGGANETSDASALSSGN
jgi:hypothetical protein